MVSVPSFVVSRLRRRAIERGRGVGLWRRVDEPSMADWAEYLRRHGGFRSFGSGCMMNSRNVFTDPYLTSIGNRVWIAGAWISGHDSSAIMMGNAFGTSLDAVGPVRIGDDVFIGYGAIVLPNTTIGNRVIVGAGSVVSGSIPDDSVVAGAPARRIRSFKEHFERMTARTESYPWRDVIAARDGAFDPAIEPGLQAARVRHFFPSYDPTPQPGSAV